MIKAVLYHSNSGFTKQYALLFSKNLKVPCYDIKNVPKNLKKEEVIFLGNVFDGIIEGYSKAQKKYNLVFSVAVGLNEPTEKVIKNLKEINKIKEKFYYLKGGFDLSKLSKFKQLTVNAYNVMYGKKEITKERQEVLKYFKTKITFVSEKKVKSIIKEHEKK